MPYYQVCLVPNLNLIAFSKHQASGLNIDLPISEAKDIQNQTYNWEDTDLYFSGFVSKFYQVSISILKGY